MAAKTILTPTLNYYAQVLQSCLNVKLSGTVGAAEAHLYLLVAAGEFPLLEDGDMVADPLEQEGHQLVIFLPAQLQVLRPAQQKGGMRV